MISISLASGVSPDVWWDQDYRTLVTAAELLQSEKTPPDSEGRQMSG